MSKSEFGFPPQCRLTTPAAYKNVFAKAVKSQDKYFTLLAIKNQLDHPRLGLAIAKKVIKRAVDRNSIKRLARESFRLRQHTLSALDIVVLARRDVLSAPAEILRESLEKLMLQLVKRCNT